MNVIFILVEHLLSFYFYFYILEELYLMVHTFIIQILGFQEFFFSYLVNNPLIGKGKADIKEISNQLFLLF